MYTNNTCDGCHEEKPEVDHDDLIDLCNECNNKVIKLDKPTVTVVLLESKTELEQVPIIEQAVIHVINELPEEDKVKLLSMDNIQSIVSWIVEGVIDIICFWRHDERRES